jgi:hypothetical protein
MIVNKMEKATEYTEFTEKKNISSEFCPSGAAGPHPPDLSGVLSPSSAVRCPFREGADRPVAKSGFGKQIRRRSRNGRQN